MAYCSGFRGAKEFRKSLETVSCLEEVKDAVEQFEKSAIAFDNLSHSEDSNITTDD